MLAVLFATDLLLNSSGLSIILVTDKIRADYVRSVIKLIAAARFVYGIYKVM